MLPTSRVERAVAQLQDDLDDRTWHERYGDLLAQPELDVGLRLAVAH
jgi:hypothetical protein